MINLFKCEMMRNVKAIFMKQIYTFQAETVRNISWEIVEGKCSCGNEPADTMLEESRCNFTCPGNPDEMCGGKNESVYSMYGYINNIGKYNILHKIPFIITDISCLIQLHHLCGVSLSINIYYRLRETQLNCHLLVRQRN